MFHAISKSLLSRSSPRPFSILAAVRFVASRLTLSLSLSFSFVGRSEKNHDDHTTNDGKWLLAGEMDPYAGILRHPSGETAMRGRRDPPATFSAFKAALQCHFPLGPRITQRRADGFSVSFPRVFPRLFSHFDIYIYILSKLAVSPNVNSSSSIDRTEIIATNEPIPTVHVAISIVHVRPT